MPRAGPRFSDFLDLVWTKFSNIMCSGQRVSENISSRSENLWRYFILSRSWILQSTGYGPWIASFYPDLFLKPSSPGFCSEVTIEDKLLAQGVRGLIISPRSSEQVDSVNWWQGCITAVNHGLMPLLLVAIYVLRLITWVLNGGVLFRFKGLGFIQSTTFVVNQMC